MSENNTYSETVEVMRLEKKSRQRNEQKQLKKLNYTTTRHHG